MHPNGTRLFFGFEHRSDWLSVVALDVRGQALLRTCFPLPHTYDLDLDEAPVADVVAALCAFVRAHDGRPVCVTDRTPGVLEPIAVSLGGQVHLVDHGELDQLAWPGFGPSPCHRQRGAIAHQRALLAGLACAAQDEP